MILPFMISGCPMCETMKSKVFQVRPDSASLRGTIPQFVVEGLKLSHRDTLDWQIEARDGKIIAIVEKVVE